MAGTSLVVRWLGLCAATVGSTGSFPGWGTKIPQGVHAAKKEKKKKWQWELILLKKKKTRNSDLSSIVLYHSENLTLSPNLDQHLQNETIQNIQLI